MGKIPPVEAEPENFNEVIRRIEYLRDRAIEADIPRLIREANERLLHLNEIWRYVECFRGNTAYRDEYRIALVDLTQGIYKAEQWATCRETALPFLSAVSAKIERRGEVLSLPDSFTLGEFYVLFSPEARFVQVTGGVAKVSVYASYRGGMLVDVEGEKSSVYLHRGERLLPVVSLILKKRYPVHGELLPRI